MQTPLLHPPLTESLNPHSHVMTTTNDFSGAMPSAEQTDGSGPAPQGPEMKFPGLESAGAPGSAGCRPERKPTRPEIPHCATERTITHAPI